MSGGPIPVFVLGCGRSGTTVTARLLNHLPGVHIAKETGYLNQHFDLLRQIDQPHQAALRRRTEPAARPGSAAAATGIAGAAPNSGRVASPVSV